MNKKLEDVLEQALELHQMGLSLAEEFLEQIKADKVGREKLLVKLTSWSHWYSLGSADISILIAELMGIAVTLSEAEDRVDARLTFVEKAKTHELSLDEATGHFGAEVAEKLVLQVIFANYYSQLAISQRNRSINVMLEQIREQVPDYQEVIFEAVSIDPTVVSNFEIANHIAHWTISNDTAQLGKLSKAIVGKYPRRREESLDEHRFMTTVLEELTGSLKPETVDNMNQLLNLLQEGEDPVEAIKYHLRVRKKDTRRANTH